MIHTINLVETRLSDNSAVFNVTVGSITFPCVTLRDAADFIEKIEDAVKPHTNEETVIVSTRERELG